MESGSSLDRIGIYQALARCNERLGHLREAGGRRRKAGQRHLALKEDDRTRDEHQHLSLVEYRHGVQDLQGNPSLADVAKEYTAVLRDNFARGAECLTHEGLFAGAFFQTLGDHLTAARYFFDTAEKLSEEASAMNDVELGMTTIQGYKRAMGSTMKAGRPNVVRVTQMRAYDLEQTP